MKARLNWQLFLTIVCRSPWLKTSDVCRFFLPADSERIFLAHRKMSHLISFQYVLLQKIFYLGTGLDKWRTSILLCCENIWRHQGRVCCLQRKTVLTCRTSYHKVSKPNKENCKYRIVLSPWYVFKRKPIKAISKHGGLNTVLHASSTAYSTVDFLIDIDSLPLYPVLKNSAYFMDVFWKNWERSSSVSSKATTLGVAEY